MAHRHSVRAPAWSAPVLLALGLAATGCVSSNRPDPAACGAPSASLTVSVDATRMTPGDPAVCRGQRVTMTIDSSVEGVLHIHGYDEEVPLVDLTLGRTRVAFEASRSGQFAIELHTTDVPAGHSIGILTVHEP